jgi:hypothetical protein
MHDGWEPGRSVEEPLGGYPSWAASNDSPLIVIPRPPRTDHTSPVRTFPYELRAGSVRAGRDRRTRAVVWTPSLEPSASGRGAQTWTKRQGCENRHYGQGARRGAGYFERLRLRHDGQHRRYRRDRRVHRRPGAAAVGAGPVAWTSAPAARAGSVRGPRRALHSPASASPGWQPMLSAAVEDRGPTVFVATIANAVPLRTLVRPRSLPPPASGDDAAGAAVCGWGGRQ